jgi:hypothetical protein
VNAVQKPVWAKGDRPDAGCWAALLFGSTLQREVMPPVLPAGSKHRFSTTVSAEILEADGCTAS